MHTHPNILNHGPPVVLQARENKKTRGGETNAARFGTNMAGKGGMWVFYFLQGEDGDSVENPNAFNVRQIRVHSFPDLLGVGPRRQRILRRLRLRSSARIEFLPRAFPRPNSGACLVCHGRRYRD